MNAWTWVLAALCALGVVLAIVPSIGVLVRLKRVNARVKDLRNSRFMLSVQSLQIQSARLSDVTGKAAPLTARAQSAVESIRESASALKMAQAKRAMQQAGSDIAALLETLR